MLRRKRGGQELNTTTGTLLETVKAGGSHALPDWELDDTNSLHGVRKRDWLVTNPTHKVLVAPSPLGGEKFSTLPRKSNS